MLLNRNTLLPDLSKFIATCWQRPNFLSLFVIFRVSLLLFIPNLNAQTTADTPRDTEQKHASQNNAGASTAGDKNNSARSTTSAISAELGQIKADFIRQLPLSQIQQGAPPSHGVLWLDQPAMTSFQKGNVILLPDQSQHAASPKLINFLRNQMPDFGWHTRALQVSALPATANDHLAELLPSLDSPEPAAAPKTAPTDTTEASNAVAANVQRAEATKNSETPRPESAEAQGTDTATSESESSSAAASSGPELLDYQQQFADQLSYIVAQQHNAGATIIIAEGSSAAVVNHMIKNNKLQNISAVILISAYIAAPKLNADAALAMAQHNVPVLDISFSSDNRFILDQQRYRAQLARKYIKELYRQRHIISGQPQEMEQQWVWKEIYGWLSHIGY